MEIEKYNKLVDFIDENSQRRDEGVEIQRYFYASTILDCKRRIYFLFKGVKPTDTINSSQKRIFSMGDILHKDILDDFKRARIWCDEEQPNTFELVGVKTPFNVKIDCIIEWEGLKIPVEIKSIKTLGFYNDKFGVFKQPKTEHVYQLMLYIHVKKTPYGFLIYHNKDNQARICYKVYYDENIIKDIIERCREIEKFLEKNKEPPLPKEHDYRCCYVEKPSEIKFFCKYYSLCYPDKED